MHNVVFMRQLWIVYYIWNYHVKYTDCSSILYLDSFSFHISVKSHVFHVKYTDISSILYLDTFSVHLSVKFYVTIVKYTDFSSILYLDTLSVQLFVKSDVTMLSIQIWYKYHIYVHCIL